MNADDEHIATDRGHLDAFERKLRIRLTAWLESAEGRSHRYAEELKRVPDLFNLCTRLMLEQGVPERYRPLLLGAVIYVVSPADMLPESLVGPLGYVDDLMLMALVLRRLLREAPTELLQDLWVGDGDIAALLEHLVELGPALVGEVLWDKLRDWVTSG